MSLVTMIFVSAPALADTVLKGNASQEDTLNNAPGTRLNRTEVGNMTDPFNSSAPTTEDPADPPKFKLETVKTSSPPPPSADLEPLNPTRAEPEPEHAQPKTQTQTEPKDTDVSPQMKIAWAEWHKRVALAIFQRYSPLANAAFANSARPLAAVASYVVTRDGRITNARLTEPNVNPVYNAIVLSAINSLNGNLQILQFPQGSRRITVDKASTFIQDNQQGLNRFKPIGIDDETITH